MSDVTIPSYRVARDRSSGLPARMLLVAGGLLGMVAVGGAVAWGVGRMGGIGGPRSIPVIEPLPGPIKVKPDNPGGLIVPNTDQLVLEPLAVRRAAERQQGANAQLAPQPEAPQLDLLRRAAAPPAPPPAAPGPTPIQGVEGVPDAPPVRPGAPGASALGNRGAALPPPTPGAAPANAPATQVAALPPPRPASEASPATAGRAQVQLGALTTEEAARAEWARLQRRVPALAGRQPQILRLDRGAEQPPLWRLRAGGLPDANAARELCEAVRAAGGACTPVAPPPAAAAAPRAG